jgi:hypothetical protein
MMQCRISLFLALPILMTACGGSSSSTNASSSGAISGNWQMALQKAPTTTAHITVISRASDVVSATVNSTTGFSVSSEITVSGVTDPTYNGAFVLSAVDSSTNVLEWTQSGPNSSSTGGSIAQNAVPPKTSSGFLVQNGDIVTGSIMFTDPPCSGVGSVDATVSGASISLQLNPAGVNINLSGIIGSGQNSMSGSYTILSTGCSNGSETGTWTANLVAPLKGNIQATFTSKFIGPLALTGQLSQGPNTGISNASLTGHLSAANYCFSTANITGLISGTSVVMNLVNPDGTIIGQVSGTASLDGTSVAGTYQVTGLGKGAEPNPPCVNGDSGTVTMTL